MAGNPADNNDPQAGAPELHEPLAKPARGFYRRNLPHLQPDDRTFFVTFCTYQRRHLPAHVRQAVLEHCLHEDGHRAWVHGVVAMPDHVHIIMTPLRDAQGRSYGLTEIMNSIKGASAHTVNRELGRRGHVWQAESFHRVLRSRDDLREKVEYICANPVRKGLVASVDSYLWLWREYVEGV
jgi:REP element-mobilizing transposase RayT